MLFVVFDSKSFHAYGGFFATDTNNVFVALSTTGIIFAYLGFRQALDYAGESKNPKRDVPLATILSIVITTISTRCSRSASSAPSNWGVASGFLSDELQEIINAEGGGSAPADAMTAEV